MTIKNPIGSDPTRIDAHQIPIAEMLTRGKASSGVTEKIEMPAVDIERIDNTTLALLQLGLHEGSRVWKTFEWETMNRLHAKGLISNPRSKAESVVLTEQGLRKSERLFKEMFTLGDNK